MKSKESLLVHPQLNVIEHGEDGLYGLLTYENLCKYISTLSIIASWGLEWDHVSVSLSFKCPSWNEMCYVRDVFFKNDEWVIQYHPPHKNYVNIHPFTLHLWRPQDETLLIKPPKEFV